MKLLAFALFAALMGFALMANADSNTINFNFAGLIPASADCGDGGGGDDDQGCDAFTDFLAAYDTAWGTPDLDDVVALFTTNGTYTTSDGTFTPDEFAGYLLPWTTSYVRGDTICDADANTVSAEWTSEDGEWSGVEFMYLDEDRTQITVSNDATLESPDSCSNVQDAINAYNEAWSAQSAEALVDLLGDDGTYTYNGVSYDADDEELLDVFATQLETNYTNTFLVCGDGFFMDGWYNTEDPSDNGIDLLYVDEDTQGITSYVTYEAWPPGRK